MSQLFVINSSPRLKAGRSVKTSKCICNYLLVKTKQKKQHVAVFFPRGNIKTRIREKMRATYFQKSISYTKCSLTLLPASLVLLVNSYMCLFPRSKKCLKRISTPLEKDVCPCKQPAVFKLFQIKRCRMFTFVAWLFLQTMF